MRRNQQILLTCLAIDNFGSGLFLPLSVLYANQIVGLPLGLAGTALTLGALVGLAMPPIAGPIVDRFGPRIVLIISQVIQAAGAFCFLEAKDLTTTILAAALLSAGQQVFYCSVFALIADVAAAKSKEKAFAIANMVRSAAFGLGALAFGSLLIQGGFAGFKIAVAVDGASFLIAAILLTQLSVPHAATRKKVDNFSTAPSVLRNRPYLALIFATGLSVLAVDFFLVGFPVFVTEQIDGPIWLPGLSLAIVTVLTSVGGTLALHITRRMTRIGALRLGGILYAIWSGLCLVTPAIPTIWWPVYLLATTPVLASASLIFMPRATALSEAAAPPSSRGRYLAVFQYAFTFAQIITPLIVGLFTVSIWLPWAVIGGAGIAAVLILPVIGKKLPEEAVLPLVAASD